jgi:pyruvate kinase
MDNIPDSTVNLINELVSIKDYASRLEKRFSEELLLVHPEMKKSAHNLLHYIALRKSNMSELQRKLGELGLSRLAKTESHVMAGVNSVLGILNLLQGKEIKSEGDFLSFQEGDQLLDKNSEALLGGRPGGRRVRIMVTLPDEAADDYSIIENLLISGMDCARINCAHGDTILWSKIIENVKKGNKELNKNCKINMDLCGPKLRTGSMTPGPQVLHIQPERDPLGKVITPAVITFIPDNEPPLLNSPVPQIPLPAGFLKNLSKGDKLVMADSRGKEIAFKILEREGKERSARCTESAYIVSGAKITIKNDKTKKSKSSKIGYLKPLEGSIKLRKGDTLVLHKEDRPGEAAVCDAEGNVITPAHISCTLPEVFEDVRTGEPILLDDGKIEGVIKTVSAEFIEIEITYAKAAGTTLRADKGINLPGSNLRIKGLTAKDKDDLKFIAANADIVSLSFVNTAQDVLELYSELKLLNSSIGIILKIETQRAFDNLPDILLTGMRSYPFGIMIARGDLAVECGWNHLAVIQEEILMLCEASHVPNIWATQVLETLAKKGRPSRAEITDAAMSQRAECVMLNKGPHIFDAVILLDKILTGMQGYQRKKKPMLPTLKLPHVFES